MKIQKFSSSYCGVPYFEEVSYRYIIIVSLNLISATSPVFLFSGEIFMRLRLCSFFRVHFHDLRLQIVQINTSERIRLSIEIINEKEKNSFTFCFKKMITSFARIASNYMLFVIVGELRFSSSNI